MGEILKKATQGNTAFWVCLVISILLIIGGAITQPPFVIDASIFIATGELFAFAGLWTLNKAIDKGVDAKVNHNGTEIQIINDNENKNDNDNKEQVD